MAGLIPSLWAHGSRPGMAGGLRAFLAPIQRRARGSANGHASTVAGIPEDAPWWSSADAASHRRALIVHAAGYPRRDLVIDTEFAPALAGFDPATIRVVELGERATIIDQDVPHQFDRADGGRLIFVASGETAASQTRWFQVYFGNESDRIPAKPVDRQLMLDTDSYDEDQDAFKVTAATATFFFQKNGASFSSIVDRDGNDWVGYHPEPTDPDEPKSNFRGVPNFHSPEGQFHPGFAQSRTELVASGPLKVLLRSHSSTGGTWTCDTAFYPQFMTSTVTEAAANYWWLYEGTPGGEGPDHRVKPFKVVRGDGVEFGYRDDWVKTLRRNPWVAFRVPGLGSEFGRSLFVAQHTPDWHADAYYLAEDNGGHVGPLDRGSMTVFGFGRHDRRMTLRPSQCPNRFSLGLVEPHDAASLSATVEGLFRAADVRHGADESRALVASPS